MRATFRAIVAEKAAAVALADTNLATIGELKGMLTPADYQDLEERLRLATDLARVYQGLNVAYLVCQTGRERAGCSGSLSRSGRSRARSARSSGDDPGKALTEREFVTKQAPRLRALQSDLKDRFARVHASNGSNEQVRWPLGFLRR